MAEIATDPGQEPPRTRDGSGGRRRVLRPAGLVVVLVAAVAIVAPGLLSGQAAAPTLGPSPSPVPSGPLAVSGAASPTPETASPSTNATASPAASTSAHAPRWVAVIDDAGALSTMDDIGGASTSYDVPGIAFGFPAWSPDGTRVAAVGYGANATSIYVFTAQRGGSASQEPVVIYRSVDSPPFYLYWTPDGKQLAFLATEGTGIALRIAPADGSAPLDGSGPKAMIRLGAPLYYDWAGSDRLLLHVGVGAASFTGEVGLDTASAAPELPGTGDFRAASVSRDGRYLAYVRSITESSGMVAVATRDGTTHHDVSVFGPAAFNFDPAGDSLALIGADAPVTGAPAFPIGPLRLIDAGSGSVRTLLAGSVIGFFWSPDGRTIATLSLIPGGPTADAGLALARAVPVASVAPLATPEPGADVALAFVDVATGVVRSQRVVRLANHFVSELLPYFDQYALSHRIWSPDSASILLPLVDATGRTRVDMVPADGTDVRSVADGVGGFWSP